MTPAERKQYEEQIEEMDGQEFMQMIVARCLDLLTDASNSMLAGTARLKIIETKELLKLLEAE